MTTSYELSIKNAAAHLFAVKLTIAKPLNLQTVFMPVWVPGSYLIREFARHVVTISAKDKNNKPVAIDKINKNTWQLQSVEGPVTIEYEIYAWDWSVRAAVLDRTLGFFNGTSVFLAVAEQTNHPCQIKLVRPANTFAKNWKVATALRESKQTNRYDFGWYEADSYDELVDHPVLMSHFELKQFTVNRVIHDVVIQGVVPKLNWPQLLGDLKKICQTQVHFFEPDTQRAPMKRYVFITLVDGNSYGGLEHRASTVLMSPRGDLPVIGEKQISSNYCRYLGLCSHEYFHTWNVKRIKPSAFIPYNFHQENYTQLLWLFEGVTSYYDDLILCRSGIISEEKYLGLLSKTISKVMQGEGRYKQTLAESSFDTWIKFYRQDENATNAIVSYYLKGSLAALVLDLKIRQMTNGERSLDDFMRLLWQRYGITNNSSTHFHANNKGVEEKDISNLIYEATQLKLGKWLQEIIYTTKDLPLKSLLKAFGLTLLSKPINDLPVCTGAVLSNKSKKIAFIHANSPAQLGGLSAFDELVAINSIQITHDNFSELLKCYRPGDEVIIHAFRRDVLQSFEVKLGMPLDTDYQILISDSDPLKTKKRSRWLLQQN